MDSNIVVPGEMVSDKPIKAGYNVFSENGKLYSNTLGIPKTDKGIARVVPLKGKYMPKEGDLVIGIVLLEEYSFYLIDINSFYHSFLRKEEIRVPLKKGSVISAKISNVNEINEVSLNNLRAMHSGEIIPIEPTKVPRVIGTSASMLKVLQKGTNCSILVGMNGWIWANGEPENLDLLKTALQKIEKESHLKNLTSRIQEFLEKKENV